MQDQVSNRHEPPLTLADYQTMIDDWVNTVGVRYFSELTNTAILMEEVGEVARIMARSYGDQSFKASEAQIDLAAELAVLSSCNTGAGRLAPGAAGHRSGGRHLVG